MLSVANTAPLALGSVVAAAVVTVIGYRALFAVAIVLALFGGAAILRVRRVR